MEIILALFQLIMLILAIGFWIRVERAMKATVEAEKHLSIIAHLLTKQDRERQNGPVETA